MSRLFRRRRWRSGVLILGLLLSVAGLAIWQWSGRTGHQVVAESPSVTALSPAPPARSGWIVYDIPMKLRIPAIAVDVSVVRVGLSADGEMVAPESSHEVGWYDRGPFPGNKGNAVVAGHVAAQRGNGVFARLGELHEGAVIETVDAQEQTAAFVVVKQAVYELGEAPREEIFGASEERRLNLVTCTGAWDEAAQTYSHRRVVYAIGR